MIQPLRLDRLSFVVPPDAHSLAGFRSWAASDEFPEYAKISLIDGELLVDMSPERLETHNWVKTEILRVLANIVHDAKLGQVCSDGAWITNDAANLSTEPDAAFVSWESLRCGGVEIIPSTDEELDGIEIQGSPDWVLEVVSPTSVRKDTRLLPAAYHRAGVREFWLVDARGTELNFTILVWGEAGFEASALREGWSDSPLFGRQFRLTRERSPRGGWWYTLDVRERESCNPPSPPG